MWKMAGWRERERVFHKEWTCAKTLRIRGVSPRKAFLPAYSNRSLMTGTHGTVFFPPVALFPVCSDVCIDVRMLSWRHEGWICICLAHGCIPGTWHRTFHIASAQKKVNEFMKKSISNLIGRMTSNFYIPFPQCTEKRLENQRGIEDNEGYTGN